MLVTSREMVRDAYSKGYAVPAINTQGGNYDIIRAICAAAQEIRSPVILAHYTATGKYSGDDWFAEVAIWNANKVDIPVAVHLDHGDCFDTCVRALKFGFTSIMLDCSKYSIEENIIMTNEVKKICDVFDVPVEAEVGELIRIDSSEKAHEHKNIAKVDDVIQFLSGCSPDMLAVGIGNVHGFYTGEPVIRLDILEQISQKTDIPLVLHGCTGMSEVTIREAITYGVSKINFGTLVRYKYLEYYKEGLETLDHQGHSWKISQFSESKLRQVIKDIIVLSGSDNKA